MEWPNDQRRIEIEPSLKRMILIELIFPMVLLILGIYHGLMQTLYRAGIIHSRQMFGLEYFQGLTLHGVVNAIVFTTFFAVAFGYAVVRFYLGRPLNMKVAWLSFALMVIGTLLAAAAILSGKASVLYTFYPPIRAHPAFYIGLCSLWSVRGSHSSTGSRPISPGRANIPAKKSRSASSAFSPPSSSG